MMASVAASGVANAQSSDSTVMRGTDGDMLGVLNKGAMSDNSSGIEIHGNFRYRHELIDQEATDPRNRARIRARLNLTTKVSDTVTVLMQLASGASDSPTTTNQTLDDSFAQKQVWLDKAYFIWEPDGVSGMTVYGGKMTNPLYKPNNTQLLWDGDVTPEGLSASYSRSLEGAEMFLNGSTFVMDERETDVDSWLFGGQAGLRLTGLPISVTVGGGWYTFTEAKGNPTFYNATSSRGNSVDATGHYTGGFREVEGFFDAGAEVANLPVIVFGDVVSNMAADDDNLGYLAGIAVGKCVDQGSWNVHYNYRYVERDAVMAAFTGSHFDANGTDGKGHMVKFIYRLRKNIQPTISYYLFENGLDHGLTYQRLKMDVTYLF